jgi:hypothetical protein
VPRPFPIESGTISKPECNFTHFTINFLFAPFHFSPRSFWCQIDQLPYHYPAIILKRRTTPFPMIVTYPFHVSSVAKTDQQRAAPVPPNFTSVTASASSRARGGGLILGAPCLKLHLIKHGPVCMGFGGLRTEKRSICRLLRRGRVGNFSRPRPTLIAPSPPYRNPSKAQRKAKKV